jgi:hypothetical protein
MLPASEEETVVLEPEPDESVLGELRRRRREMGTALSHEILVPGYQGMVALRVGPISGQQQSRLMERMTRSKSPEKDVNLNADYLIAACREVVVRREGEQWQSIPSEDGTVGLDERLVDALELPPVSKARDVLRALFSLAPSPEIAITIAGGEYISWAAGQSEELDEEFLGE